jgi:NAD(P)H-dependent FMN reductase
LPERKVFADKKMFLLATSPGARGGATVLETAVKRFPFNGGVVVSSFCLPSFHQNFNDELGITNEELKKQLQDIIQKISF